MSMGSIVPAIAQGATGILQGGMEGIMQLLNLFRREGIAQDIERAGSEAASQFSAAIDPLLDRSSSRLAELDREQDLSFADQSTTLRQGRDAALSQYGRATDTAQHNLDMTMRLGQESLERTRAENQTLMDEMRTRADAAVAVVRTNMTERAGATTAGLRNNAARAAAEFGARARQEGRLSEAEIQREERRIKEQGVTEASRVWGEAFTGMSEQLLTARVTGNNMMAELGSSLRTSLTSLESSVLGATTGAMSLLSGAVEFDTTGRANLYMGEAQLQNEITTARLAASERITNANLALDEARMSSAQYVIETVLNSRYAAGSMRAGFTWQAPNLTGLLAPAFANLNSSLASERASGEKSSWSASLPVVGGGGGMGCVDAMSTIETPGGYLPMKDVLIGMHALGGDGKYHKVIGKDIGLLPSTHQLPYVLIQGLATNLDNGHQTIVAVCVTQDHPICGTTAAEVKVGMPLPNVCGPATVASVSLVPYRFGADLELEGCREYFANGVLVGSQITDIPAAVKPKLVEVMRSRGQVLAGY